MLIEPSSRDSRPIIILNNVVLPAPFAPMIPTMPPRGSLNSRFWNSRWARHPLAGQLLLVARAEAGATAPRGEERVRPPPHAPTRARVDSNVAEGKADEVQGSHQLLQRPTRPGVRTAARRDGDNYRSPGPQHRAHGAIDALVGDLRIDPGHLNIAAVDGGSVQIDVEFEPVGKIIE